MKRGTLCITNIVVEKWRERKQYLYPDYSETPLPVVINLKSGPRMFWGDEQVYYWYRPNSNGPNVIISALTALELWMEKQVEEGRNAVWRAVEIYGHKRP
jgi:hypothetical protein